MKVSSTAVFTSVMLPISVPSIKCSIFLLSIVLFLLFVAGVDELIVETWTDLLKMDETAHPSPATLVQLKLPTTSFAEVNI